MGYFTQEMAVGSLIAGWRKQTVFHLKTDPLLKFKRVFKVEYHIFLKACVCVRVCVCRLHYPCAGQPWVRGYPYGRQRWGLERRIAGSVCFVGAALAPAAPCMEQAAALWPTGRQRCAQTPAPGRCKCCQPDRNGRLPPERRKKQVKWNEHSQNYLYSAL